MTRWDETYIFNMSVVKYQHSSLASGCSRHKCFLVRYHNWFLRNSMKQTRHTHTHTSELIIFCFFILKSDSFALWVFKANSIKLESSESDVVWAEMERGLVRIHKEGHWGVCVSLSVLERMKLIYRHTDNVWDLVGSWWLKSHLQRHVFMMKWHLIHVEIYEIISLVTPPERERGRETFCRNRQTWQST